VFEGSITWFVHVVGPLLSHTHVKHDSHCPISWLFLQYFVQRKRIIFSITVKYEKRLAIVTERRIEMEIEVGVAINILPVVNVIF